MKKKGFTLIELLVVIAIIGILATIVIINVANAREKATDSKAMADISQSAKIASLCSSQGVMVVTPNHATKVICLKPNSNPFEEHPDYTGKWPVLTKENGYGKWRYNQMITINTVLYRTGNGTNTTWGVSAISDTNANSSHDANEKGIGCNFNGCDKLNF